jgi:hypothetical protein
VKKGTPKTTLKATTAIECAENKLRASTHYAHCGCVLLDVYYSKINFFLFFTQNLQLTKT